MTARGFATAVLIVGLVGAAAVDAVAFFWLNVNPTFVLLAQIAGGSVALGLAWRDEYAGRDRDGSGGAS